MTSPATTIRSGLTSGNIRSAISSVAGVPTLDMTLRRGIERMIRDRVTWDKGIYFERSWVSAHRKAAVDNQICAGHVIRCARGQEHHCAGELLRLAETAARRSRHHLFEQFGIF